MTIFKVLPATKDCISYCNMLYRVVKLCGDKILNDFDKRYAIEKTVAVFRDWEDAFRYAQDKTISWSMTTVDVNTGKAIYIKPVMPDNQEKKVEYYVVSLMNTKDKHPLPMPKGKFPALKDALLFFTALKNQLEKKED